MCGRYTLSLDKEISELKHIFEQVKYDAQYRKMKTGEIFPTNVVPVLIPETKEPGAHLFTWGFPSFHGKNVIINARSESVHEKRMFKSSLEKRRCVIPSTGFYEWDSEKKKFLFNLPDSSLLYMAGIYNQFEGENRFVILTTAANSSVSDVHERMPVVLPEDKIENWLFEYSAVDYILFSDHPGLVKEIS
ncbi:MAG: SOS response-associated peptidase [Clostridiaceae bacterium]